MSPLLEQALKAATETEAANILEAGGHTPGGARELAAIAFGSLGGDIVGDSADAGGLLPIPSGRPDVKIRLEPGAE